MHNYNKASSCQQQPPVLQQTTSINATYPSDNMQCSCHLMLWTLLATDCASRHYCNFDTGLLIVYCYSNSRSLATTYYTVLPSSERNPSLKLTTIISLQGQSGKMSSGLFIEEN